MKRYPAIVALLFGLTASTTALAGSLRFDQKPPKLQPDRFAPRSAPDEPPQSEGISAQEAAREAQQRNGGGRVLSVDEAGSGWRVKLLKDGNVRIVFVPN